LEAQDVAMAAAKGKRWIAADPDITVYQKNAVARRRYALKMARSPFRQGPPCAKFMAAVEKQSVLTEHLTALSAAGSVRYRAASKYHTPALLRR
jgi:hypothetical protein